MGILKPDVSLTVALATGAVVWGIYSNALPTLPDVRVGKPHDTDVDGARKAATWTAAGVVGTISLIAKDANVFIVGGGMVIAADWWFRHANAKNPMVAGVTPSGATTALQDQSPDTTFMSGIS